ncbi:peptidase P60 [Siculibacillus lacustris]|uniref:Peptidase P60 n=1 Tax=Siculibacillus lacustris TaxID=1549641 RepID=A0A4Q9VU93_9HYPH|nr:NlpC/P60 family protein [Siculibacillus lacustris]TBW39311.1 peptidase P60 [Siculibacillus lacustris]
MDFDPRLTPARSDLAARRLQARVTAERFVDGTPARVVVGLAPLRRGPRGDARLDTEALAGESLTVYDEDEEGWGWVQLDRDGYVGYLPTHAYMKGDVARPTHRVTALRTFVYPALSIKEPPLDWLTLGARIAGIAERVVDGRAYVITASGGVVVADHLAPLDRVEADPVVVAERFLGTPYLWGGRSSLGIDCSGLVQTALEACGVAAPRDTDLQEAALGTPVDLDPAQWRRGDLLFWPGHVGLVRDATTFLHANAHVMAVSIEPIAAGLARIAAAGAPLRSVRRVERPQ